MLLLTLAFLLTSADPDFEAMKTAWNRRHAERIEFDRKKFDEYMDQVIADAKTKIEEAKRKRDDSIKAAGMKTSTDRKKYAANAKSVYEAEISGPTETIKKEKEGREFWQKEADKANRLDDDPASWREGFFGKMSKQQFRVRSVDSKDTVTATFGDKTYILTGIDATGATPGKPIDFSGWYYVEKPRQHALGNFISIRAVP